MQRRSKFDLKSAMHKELRRGDAKRALAFGRELVRSSGKGHIIKNYIRSIILEETRNSTLLTSRAGDFTWEEWVVKLTASRKKWESTTRKGLFDQEVNAFVKALELGRFKSKKEIQEEIAKFDSIKKFYTLIFRVFYEFNEAQLRVMQQALIKRILRESWKLPPWLPDIAERKPEIYPTMMIGEVLCGKWSRECEEIRDVKIPTLTKKESTPTLRDYTYDIHTRTGKERMKKVWNQIKPNEPLPNGIDLRWSGMLLGVLWRYKAFEQFGDEYKNVSWEDVKISKSLWRKTKVYDSWWYENWYDMVEPDVWDKYA